MYHNQLIITGKIVLKTPVHIGSGEFGNGCYKGPFSEPVQFVVKDKDDLPYIPASSLKGALRRLCQDYQDELFGCPKDSKGRRSGKIGQIYFSNCDLIRRDSYLNLVENLPHHKENAPIYVSSRTRIDRKTGAADQGEGEGGKLFNFEMVAPGVAFTFEWRVLNATKESKRRINHFLTCITGESGFLLGNSKSSGNGHVTIPADSIRIMHVAASGQQTREAFEPVSAEQIKKEIGEKWISHYELELNALGPYISINHDVTRNTKSEDPQIEPMIDVRGKPLLPPTSVRGVLRKRAAWIDQQIREGESDNRDQKSSNDYSFEEITNLTPTQRLFGVTGWRGLLEIEKVDCIETGTELKHTSVAIDRFTGGSLRHALFKTRCFVKPSFKVIFKLRKAMAKDGNHAFPNGTDKKLLSALIADIEENGLQLGHGISKGFGWFDVKIIKGEKGSGWDDYFTQRKLGRPSPWPASKISDKDKDSLVNKLKAGHDKAPYNFVHIEDEIVLAPTGSGECHDKPVKEGVSGVLDMRYSVETPLLIGSDCKIDGFIQSVQLGMEPGDYALPGSSLKGMIRSVYEIATYSGIGFMNEDCLTYRDMTKGSPYFGIIKDTANDFHGGWLEKKEGEWYLTEADWYRIAIDDIVSKISRCTAPEWRNKTVKEKYDSLSSVMINKKKLIDGTYFQLVDPRVEKRTCKKTRREYKAVQELDFSSGGHPNSKWGKIICSDKIPKLGEGKSSNKKTETIFFDKKNAGATLVDQKVMDRFFIAYGEPGTNGEKLGDYLKYWLDRHRSEISDDNIPLIPVFFKGSVHDVEQMGMTRLMKVTYKNSLKDYLPYNQIPKKDFTQAVFGYVKKEDESKEAKTEALASRVQFGWAVLNEADRPEQGEPVLRQTTVAMCPRPTFWPYYLKQKDGPVSSKPEKMNYNGHKGRAVLAGRKRYPVHGSAGKLPSPPTSNVASKLEFIPAVQEKPLRFEGQIRFHNLHPAELGALIWAITLGRNPHLRHSLGHSKAYGYGQLKAEILSAKLIGLSYSDIKECDLDYYVNKFETYMEDNAKGWYNSRSIQSLLNMANPEIGQKLDGRLDYVGDHTVYGSIKKNSRGRGLPEFTL